MANAAVLTRRRLRAGALLAVIALAGCASPGPRTPVAGSHAVELTKVPFFPQDAYQCGPAALAEVLSFTGEPVHPEALEPYLYLPARKGTLQAEIIAQGRRQGRLVYPVKGTIGAVTAEVAAGHPVLVLQNLAFSWWPIWHYAVVVGFDPDARTVTMRSGEQARHQEPYELFERTWGRAKRWGIVILPPGQLPATAQPQAYLQAAA
ncbi:MAG: PA2778 family cysteine peptidase, partial [Gammaproteobacteria bacterium]